MGRKRAGLRPRQFDRGGQCLIWQPPWLDADGLFNEQQNRAPHVSRPRRLGACLAEALEQSNQVTHDTTSARLGRNHRTMTAGYALPPNKTKIVATIGP